MSMQQNMGCRILQTESTLYSIIIRTTMRLTGHYQAYGDKDELVFHDHTPSIECIKKY